MATKDVLPLRGAGLVSCSYDSRQHQVRRRPGNGPVAVRAQRIQQVAQPSATSRPAIGVALGLVHFQLLHAAPALAEDMAAYDASGVSDSLKNAFGVAYVAVLIGFGIRLFNKRAKRFTTEATPPPPFMNAAASNRCTSASEVLTVSCTCSDLPRRMRPTLQPVPLERSLRVGKRSCHLSQPYSECAKQATVMCLTASTSLATAVVVANRTARCIES